MTRSFRILGAAIVGLLAALALGTGAQAGGWSVVVLDRESASISSGGVTAGAPFTVGFTVLQHGQRPIDGLAPRITLTPEGGGEPVSVAAEAEGGPGHYQATIVLPTAGTWAWQIDAFGPPAVLAPLTVAAPAPAPIAPAPATLPWLAVVALVALAGVLALLVRRTPTVTAR